MARRLLGTRERILETAERLFARRGIDQISVRQINLAAGQRNASATAYHFGTKQALLTAVLDYRREAINARRLELLRKLEQAGRQNDLRALVEAMVHPLAERLGRTPDHYIRVIAQVTGHPRYQRRPQGRARHGSGLERLLELLRICLRRLPEEVLRQRFGMALRHVFNELADFQRLHLARTRSAAGISMPLFVSNLVDVVTGILGAPVSTTTREELKRSRREIA